MDRIKTPRGTFKVEEVFRNEQEANAAGYYIYFTHWDENDNQIDIYTKHLDEYHIKVGIILVDKRE